MIKIFVVCRVIEPKILALDCRDGTRRDRTGGIDITRMTGIKKVLIDGTDINNTSNYDNNEIIVAE